MEDLFKARLNTEGLGDVHILLILILQPEPCRRRSKLVEAFSKLLNRIGGVPSVSARITWLDGEIFR